LEPSWHIFKSKLCHIQDIGAHRGFEGCFVAILPFNANIVIPPSDIKFGEQLLSLEVGYEGLDIW